MAVIEAVKMWTRNALISVSVFDNVRFRIDRLVIRAVIAIGNTFLDLLRFLLSRKIIKPCTAYPRALSRGFMAILAPCTNLAGEFLWRIFSVYWNTCDWTVYVYFLGKGTI